MTALHRQDVLYPTGISGHFIKEIVFVRSLQADLVLTLSLVVFVNYRYDQLNPKTTDIIFLTIIMYFLVLVNTLVLILQEYFKGQERNKALETEREKLKRGHLTVKSDRKSIKIKYGEIVYIESVGNYVKIYNDSGKPILTKEKISTIEEKLSKSFLRIHRSIIVNVDQITSFSREWVNINDIELPISRKYKEVTIKRIDAL
jgi:DNA-binding LytR/AlgR family response regulator